MIISHNGLRVSLRDLQLTDTPLFYSEIELSSSYLRNSDILWLPHHEESIQATIASLVERNRLLPFPTTLVLLNEKNQSIGLVSLHTFDNRHLIFNYGISLLEKYQGKGYAFEAVNLLLNYMFYHNKYFKCLAKTYSFNKSSIALQRTVGFKMEGILKDSYYSKGEFIDVYLWGIDKNSFRFMHKAQ